jgi:hypothetical protein
MKISHFCPKVGQIEYDLDEAVLMAAIYPLVKAQLEEEFILVPREE